MKLALHIIEQKLTLIMQLILGREDIKMIYKVANTLIDTRLLSTFFIKY